MGIDLLGLVYNKQIKGGIVIETLKKLFTKKKEEEEHIPDPPGRTFKRVPTGRYFGHENPNADEASIVKAKQAKIDQITKLELKPMFVRYTYANNSGDHKISSAHVVFQKEVSAEKWNMTHVTEISFIVYPADFEEFEALSGVNLKEDFRDLTAEDNAVPYNGEERRKTKREMNFSSD